MNLKIALAALMLVSGGSYVSQAQQTNVTTQPVSAKSFESKIAAYEKEKDAAKAQTQLDNMKQDMMGSLSEVKMAIHKASQAGDNAAQTKLTQSYESRVQAVTGVQNATDKATTVAALKAFVKAL